MRLNMSRTSLRRLWQFVTLICILALFTSAGVESRADRRVSAADERLAKHVIFSNKCGSCHTLQARGLNLRGKVGPDLTREAQRARSPEWLKQQITNPASIPNHEVSPGFKGKQKFMPKFHWLSDRELGALIEFLRSLD